jgi:ABC-type multidrug transport system fused ATPase/permease subunit
MCILGAFLEAAGIGIVLPALAVLSDPAWLGAQPWAGRLLPEPLLSSPGALVVAVLGVLVAVVLCRSVFLTWLAYAQSSFARDFETDLSSRLLRTYLAQPWVFHAGRNSSELIRNIRHEASTVGFVFGAQISVLTESTMLLAMIGVLVALEPLPSLVLALVIGALGAGYQWSMRSRIVRWGADRQKFEGLRIQHLQQGLAAVRELRLAGASRRFADRYEHDTRAHLATVQRHSFASQMPRLLFDLLAVVALATSVLVILALGREVGEIIPTVGLFAAAATRLLPSSNKLLGALQLVRWGTPSVDVVTSELKLHAPAEPDEGTVRPIAAGAIDVADVSFRYPGSESCALDHVSARIEMGSMTGIIGASGSGKSTLLDVILGLLQPDSGTVLVGGSDIRASLAGWHRCIGYVPQSIYLFDDTLRRNVALGVDDGAIDDAQVWRALADAKLDEVVRSWPEGLEARVGERGVRLSGGQRQRIGIARALYHDPPVLVLDEATSALDVATESSVMESIVGLRDAKTIIIVAHRLSTVSRCDRVYRLEGGRVVATGSFAEVTGQTAAH